jgi:hypothetical protein
MYIFLILLMLCGISLFIPHKDKKYNFSWHFRLLSSLTIIYVIGCGVYKLTTLI